MDMAAPETTAPGTGSSSVEDGNSATVRQMIAYLNAHNVAGMLSCFDDEMEWLDVPMEVPYRGKAEIRALLDSLFDAFPDLEYEPTSLVADGDRVVVQFRMHGSHQNTFYGLPATNRRVDLPSLSMITMRNGKMLSDHCYYDNAMILRQMGIMPPLAVTLSAPGRAALWAAVKGRRVAPVIGAVAAGLFLLKRLRRSG
jgi:steroid delta-isomerase-like uncharacterized protein